MNALAPAQAFAPGPADEPVAGNYFISVYPPFSAWSHDQVPALKTVLNEPCSKRPLGLYVHIPFCQRKCDYCYYLSYTTKTSATVNRYLTALVSELQEYAAHRAVCDRPVRFVYVGGGTPSILTSSQIRFLFENLKNTLPWDKVEEITFECAPRSVRPDLLTTLKEVGVTRISMGVQSFDNLLLKLNGRIHLAGDIFRAYEMIRHAGFDYVNLDLMCGMVGETPQQWHNSVEEAIRLSPQGITLYQTEMPYNTQLYRDFKAGTPRQLLPNWTTKRARLLYGFCELERAGYTLISAYNAVKEPELHHFRYQDLLWTGGDMLGLGVASFGYINGLHVQNHASLEDYFAALDSRALPVRRAYLLTDWEQLVREFILQLKFGEVDTRYFIRKYGVDVIEMFAAPLEQLQHEGLAVTVHGLIRLTRAGLLRVDRLLPRFYDSQFRDVPYT